MHVQVYTVDRRIVLKKDVEMHLSYNEARTLLAELETVLHMMTPKTLGEQLYPDVLDVRI